MTSSSPANDKGGTLGASSSAASSSKMGDSDSGSGGGGGWDDQTLLSKTGQKVNKDDFELLTVIGKGSFGKVMQVRKKDDGKIYAMKVLRKEAIIARKQVAHTKAEKSILQKIQHPFIVNLNFAFQTEDKLYMILDYINGGELFFHLKKEGKFSEERVRLYTAEIILALSHLHSFDIVYRDLKPENILIDCEGHICITDFGLSKEITSEEGTHTFCGTPEYLAPEVLKGQGHGTAVDWWSLGTLVYEMLTGLPPFYSQNINVMYQKILNGELRFPAYVSAEAQSLLEGLLIRDPEKRLGANSSDDQAADIKSHPFFKGFDWKAIENKEVEPLFKPQVKSQTDTSQIDPVFTTETPVDSLVEKSAISEANGDTNFDGFTFVNDTLGAVADGASGL
eukprot:CAMPEP_0201550296 /NCGR_PEP_ID=MMETSP0173_2-20130828/6675_1 /ASSEMBLY_ACC=CAM_ASM_000268 /TAXON_ID=218659 /ORGANISM="Vexillifera sp., Strain DIVA3 564/2" /LENGTH=393 /DNA_ID=CAMNT_0047960229 /DNA_START=259 /DNA_END=1440 /DNA_ORIENTATION=+